MYTYLQVCSSCALWTVGVIPRHCNVSTLLIAKLLGGGTAARRPGVYLKGLLSFGS